MRQLQLDMRMVETHLMQQRRRHAPEPVAGHAAFVAHALQRPEDSVIAHGFFMVAFAGE